MAIQWNWNVLTGVLLLILRPKYCSRWSDWNKISISYKARLQIAQVLTIQSLHAGNIPSIFKTFQSLPLTFKSMISIQEEILMFCCRQHWLQKCPKNEKSILLAIQITECSSSRDVQDFANLNFCSATTLHFQTGAGVPPALQDCQLSCEKSKIFWVVIFFLQQRYIFALDQDHICNPFSFFIICNPSCSWSYMLSFFFCINVILHGMSQNKSHNKVTEYWHAPLKLGLIWTQKDLFFRKPK